MADTHSDEVAEAVESSQPVAVRRKLRLIEHRGAAEAPLTFRVIEPDDARPETPLVLALHGRGDTSEGFSRLVRALELDARVIIPDGPLPFGLVGGRQWYDMTRDDAAAQVGQRVTELAGFLVWLERTYPSASRRGLLGFSQGAVLAIEAAARIPDRFAAVAAFSGYAASTDGGVTGPSPAVLVSAGTKDGVVPQERSWAAGRWLASLGRPVRELPFAGPHAVPPVVLEGARRFFDEFLGPVLVK